MRALPCLQGANPCERPSDAMLGVSFRLHLDCGLRAVWPSEVLMALLDCRRSHPAVGPCLHVLSVWMHLQVAQQAVASRRLRAIGMVRSTDTNKFA